MPVSLALDGGRQNEGRETLTADAKHLLDRDPGRALSDDDNQRLIRDWYGRVYALCQSKLRSRADAEDATQETFLRALARLDQLRSASAVGAWLRGIAHHVCVDVIRRQKTTRISSGDVQKLATPGSDDTTQRDQQAYLIHLIHELPEQFRETIFLHYYEDMTYDDIASWLGVARSTVNERLSKGRNLLKRQLTSQGCCDEL